MKLLWVVQRFAADIAGGAEAEARQYATRLAAVGHEVEVATSCALDYITWRNELPPGDSVDQGVTVHRFPVARERSARFFTLDARVKRGEVATLVAEREWLVAQGPVLVGLEQWLDVHAGGFDVVVFTSYLYHPTIVGLPIARQHTATALTPTAHAEAPFTLSIVVPPLLLADQLVYNSREEQELVGRRTGRSIAGEVVGMGADEPPGDGGAPFRDQHGLGTDPYLLYVGRIDEGKGVGRLLESFVEYKRRNGGSLRLVLIGSQAIDLPRRQDVVLPGFVSESMKFQALRGAVALVQPSRMESFSIVAVEAWSVGTPVVCDAGSDVLVGHSMRSGGGIPYAGFAEFEATIDLLVEDAVARTRLGAAGRAYVDAEYTWPAVIARLERCLHEARKVGVSRLSGR